MSPMILRPDETLRRRVLYDGRKKETNGLKKFGNTRRIKPVINRLSLYSAVVVSHSSFRQFSGPRKTLAEIRDIILTMMEEISTSTHSPSTIC